MLDSYFETGTGNNLREKLAVLGASFGPKLTGGPYWRKTSRGPIVNKMLMEVNLEQMLRADI